MVDKLNGWVPHLGGGIALLPLGPKGEKNGVDDLLAQGYNWGDITSFIYPMDDVINMKTGEFSPKKGLTPSSSSSSHPTYEHDDDDLPALTIEEFLTESPSSYDWVVEGLVGKGAISKLAGQAKYSGKTTLLSHMASNVLDGTPFLGRATTQSKILYMTEQGRNFKEALASAGLDDPSVQGFHIVPIDRVFDLGWEVLIHKVGRYCEQKGIGFLVVDTLIEFSDNEGDDENSAGKAKATLKPLKHIATIHNLGVVITQHHNVQGRGRGSTQYDGGVDILLDLRPLDSKESDNDNPNVRMLEGIGRGVGFKTYIKLTDEGYETLTAPEGALKDVSKNARIVLRFLPILEADAVAIAELLRTLDERDIKISRATVERALKELKNEGLAESKGGGTSKDPQRYWRSEPATKDKDDPEDSETESSSSSSQAGGEHDDDEVSISDKVTPIRPGIEVSKEPSAAKQEKKGKKKVVLPTPEELAERFDCYVHTEERLAECHTWVTEQPYMSIDIETKGKNRDAATLYTKAVIRGVGLYADGKGWFLDCDHLDDEKVASFLRELETKPKYLHNSAFDIPRIYRRFGVLLNQGVHDTLIASRAARAGEWEENQSVDKQGRLTTTRPKKSLELKDCIARELEVEVPKIKQEWTGPLTGVHMEYVMDDMVHLKDLHNKLYQLIEDQGVKTAYDTIADTVHMFLEGSALGMPIDAQRLDNIQNDAKEERDKAERQLERLAKEHAPHPEGVHWVWGNSDKDTSPEGKGRAGMHRMLQLVDVKLPNLEVEPTLLDNRDRHPLVKALYDYRKAASVYSKYRRLLEDFYEDGRIFPQVRIAGTVTGRITYSDPNIQGFDKKKIQKYRQCIRAEEGFSIVKGDFAQQELRIAAWWSGDSALLGAFANGEDVYMRVAEKIVGKKVKRGTKVGENARAAAKRAVLGYLYGLGPAKYRKNVYKDTGEDISEEIAKRDRQAFRNAFPELYKWQRRYGSHKDETNLPKPDMWETRSVRGWRRVVAGQYEKKSDWKKENNIPADWIPKYTDRLNGPIQSTAGDILYLTLIKLDADLSAGLHPGTRFLFTAHDEVVLNCPEGIAKEVAAWLKSKMVEAFEEVLGPKLGGSRSVEVGGGPSWGEIEEWG